MADADMSDPVSNPSIFRWTIGFLMVGAAWGFTTPFIRRAAMGSTPQSHPSLSDPNTGWLLKRILKAWFAVLDLLRRPAYAFPLLINVTGSVWFFLLIGQAELSLTVPITNSLAFLFTVLGEWWVDGKVIARDTWIGMALVLAGIGLCVQSKA